MDSHGIVMDGYSLLPEFFSHTLLGMKFGFMLGQILGDSSGLLVNI